MKQQKQQQGMKRQKLEENSSGGTKGYGKDDMDDDERIAQEQVCHLFNQMIFTLRLE